MAMWVTIRAGSGSAIGGPKERLGLGGYTGPKREHAPTRLGAASAATNVVNAARDMIIERELSAGARGVEEARWLGEVVRALDGM